MEIFKMGITIFNVTKVEDCGKAVADISYDIGLDF